MPWPLLPTISFSLRCHRAFQPLCAIALIVCSQRNHLNEERKPGLPSPSWSLAPVRAACHHALLLRRRDEDKTETAKNVTERTKIVMEWYGFNFRRLEWHLPDFMNSNDIFLICHIYSGMDPINPFFFTNNNMLSSS